VASTILEVEEQEVKEATMMLSEDSRVSSVIWEEQVQEAKALEDNRDREWVGLGSLEGSHRWEDKEERMEFILSSLVECLSRSECEKRYCHSEGYILIDMNEFTN
jgi:hypothetical protein